MKATLLYRISSALLVIFAAANAAWLLYFWHIEQGMNPVHFPFGHSGLSYAQVILALELFCSFCVLFAAYLAWHLGTLARTAPQAIGALGWILLAYQAVGAFVALFYLSGFAFMVSVATAICTAAATSLVDRTPEASAGQAQE